MCADPRFEITLTVLFDVRGGKGLKGLTVDSQEAAIARVRRAMDQVRQGGLVIMVDDEDRENEGDLVFAADHVNAERINFLVKHARGLVCLTLAPEIVDRLRLPLMTSGLAHGRARQSTAFTVSIEAARGVTTGISAQDRAHTIRVAMDPGCQPDDLVVPGHVFPLRAQPGGVLDRAGHTEGSVDLAVLAGLRPAGVICEIMRDDGTMARRDDLEAFSAQFDLPIVSIADLIAFRLMSDSLVERVTEAEIETPYGVFRSAVFRGRLDGLEHLVLIKGDPRESEVVDVRVQVQEPVVDIFDFGEGGGRDRMHYAMRLLGASSSACLVWLSPHRPLSWADQLRSMAGAAHCGAAADPTGMDARLIGVGAQILRALGVRKMRVHMHNPRALRGLTGFGLEVVDYAAIRYTGELGGAKHAGEMASWT